MTECADANADCKSGWGHGAPVFEISFDIETNYPNGDKLPGVWISVPMEDEEGNSLGRSCTKLYPFTFPGIASEDVDGEEALYFGGCYYDEAMGYIDFLDRQKRIDCFRAAELLYRHSAGRGNAVANLCLGYVYSYDRCEGRYWRNPIASETEQDYEQPYPREERAFECFSIAAEAGIPEACYKLGDLYKHAMGCVFDADEAYRWYVRASELAMHVDNPVVLGSIALRLAGCLEEGFGCKQSFSCALQMYRSSVAALDVAVNVGESWYEKALANARAGVKRCEQELCC